ncbi:MAG: exopolysaccharide biosynthesis polyprenyl glycosylphosphotransferase [Proteobacteria bacterium]|nr:exopolysaccharide biosynthesis polyprenyl glycosylphosphotransferase [Pseudomonadota bacterium]
MINERIRTIKLLIITSDVLATLIAYMSAFFLRKYTMSADLRYIMNFNNYGLLALTSLLFIIIYDTIDLSNSENITFYITKKRTNMFQQSSILFLFITLYLYFVRSLIQSRLFLVYFFFLLNTFLLFAKIFFIPWLAKSIGMRINRRILLVGSSDDDTIDEISSTNFPFNPFFSQKIIETISYKRDFKNLPKIIKTKNINWVIFSYDPLFNNMLSQGIKFCEEMGISSSVVLKTIFPDTESIMDIEKINDVSFLSFSPKISHKISIAVKYLLDEVIAVAVSPILMIAAVPIILLIKIDSKGPIFFRQKRLGMNGKLFTIYKFRTMYVDAEQRKRELKNYNSNKVIFKLKNDPRITRIGKILRRYSLDEIPQFINVLRGEMSIIGPRPHLYNEYSEYEFWHVRRLSMRPGIACLWQVEGRSDIDFDSGVKMDLFYIDNWSILLDLKIALRLIPVIITGKGAY